jgi:hypothetical protein
MSVIEELFDVIAFEILPLIDAVITPLTVKFENQPLLPLIVPLELILLEVNEFTTFKLEIDVLPVSNPLESVDKIKLLPLICLSTNANCPPTELPLVCGITITDDVKFGYGIYYLNI